MIHSANWAGPTEDTASGWNVDGDAVAVALLVGLLGLAIGLVGHYVAAIVRNRSLEYFEAAHKDDVQLPVAFYPTTIAVRTEWASDAAASASGAAAPLIATSFALWGVLPRVALVVYAAASVCALVVPFWVLSQREPVRFMSRRYTRLHLSKATVWVAMISVVSTSLAVAGVAWEGRPS